MSGFFLSTTNFLFVKYTLIYIKETIKFDAGHLLDKFTLDNFQFH